MECIQENMGSRYGNMEMVNRRENGVDEVFFWLLAKTDRKNERETL